MKSLMLIQEEYQDATNFVKNIWRDYVGYGCGYFESWEDCGKFIRVYAEGPCRTGNQPYHVDIPKEKFDKWKDMAV